MLQLYTTLLDHMHVRDEVQVSTHGIDCLQDKAFTTVDVGVATLVFNNLLRVE